MVVTLGQQYNVGEKPTVILYIYIMLIVMRSHQTQQNVRISSVVIEPYKNRGLGQQ